MANKKCVSLDNKEYQAIIEAITKGFIYTDDKGTNHKFRPNTQLAMILQLEAVLGLRIGDILQLTIKAMPKDGNRHRFDIIEDKTDKHRTFTIPNEVYTVILDYAMENNIDKSDKLFTITERAIQKQLKIVCNYLSNSYPEYDLSMVSSHSFRKRFATTTYEQSGYNIELVRQLLQHSSTNTTQRYIGICAKQLEEALASRTQDLIMM